MSIIIKTPQPDTEERLVLVPPESVSRSVEGVSQPGACDLAVHTNNARDATADDLGRAGYVRDGDTRAGLREALRARERAELDALAELDEQRARAEKAEGLLIQRETELRLAREDGDERARDLRQAYERAMAAAEKAERERDDARTELARATGPSTEYNLRRERDDLRAELARLTAPGEGSEGEPTYEALGEHYRNAWDASEAMLEMGRRHDAYAALYRLGVAHERATHARSTDAVYRERDILAALAAKLAQRVGYPAWTAEHDLASDPTWEPEWKDIVFFRLPTGQCSWHLKAGEKAECGLDSLPVAVESWDGHTTEEKYARILAFLSQDERARQPEKGRATDEELVTIGHAAGKSQAFDGVPEGRGNTWEAWRKECDPVGRMCEAVARLERALGRLAKIEKEASRG